MPKRKIAVAMSEWLVTDLDETAKFYEISRSAVVEEAVAEYVARRASEERDAGYRERAIAAIEDMRRIAAEYASDPASAEAPSSLEVLRAIRDEE